MKRRFATLAARSALLLAFAFAFSATPALASRVMVLSFPASDLGTVECSGHTYTFASGNIIWIGRDFSAAHFSAIDVLATDEVLTPYHVVGGETYSDAGGRLTIKMMFVRQGGGVADSINVVLRAYPAGTGFFFDQGTCVY